jgi:hypothetical protein
MAVSIGISYTPSGGSPVYSFLFDQFTPGELPRSYSNLASFSFSANGSSIMTGPANQQKRIWAISGPLPTAQAISFDAMYRSWDQDRGNGLAAAIGIIDQTFGPEISTSAVITTPPTYSRMGPVLTMVSVGLTEI